MQEDPLPIGKVLSSSSAAQEGLGEGPGLQDPVLDLPTVSSALDNPRGSEGSFYPMLYVGGPGEDL